MSKHPTRQYKLAAAPLVGHDAELTAQHEKLTADGYALNEQAHCFRRKDGSTTLQLSWVRRLKGRSSSFTLTIRGL